MRTSDLVQLVSQRTADAAACPHDYERTLVDEIATRLEDATSWRAVVLDGPRQVGKSTALYQVLRRLQRHEAGQAIYCNFTDPRLRGVGLRDVVEAVLVEPKRANWFLFDEVHHVADWSRELKELVDRRTARFAVADSSATVIHAGETEGGLGRWDRLAAHPLSFGEWLALQETQGRPLPATQIESKAECERFLAFGGFPEHTLASSVRRVHERLRADVGVQAVRHDIAPLRGIREVENLERLLVSFLAGSGRQLNYSESARTATTSPKTVRDWVTALRETALIWELRQMPSTDGVRVKKPPKLYAVDPGLVAAFSTATSLEQRAQLLGRQVETAVAQALRRCVQERGGHVFFFKDGRGEIDFVVTVDGRRILVEVEAGDGMGKIPAMVRYGGRLGASDRIVVAASRLAVGSAETSEGPVSLQPLHRFLLQVEEEGL